MATPQVLVMSLLSVVVVVAVAMPNGYIINVKPECALTLAEVTKITVLVDLPAVVNVACKNGNFSYRPSDEVHIIVPVYFENNDTTTHCVFHQTNMRSHVYTVQLAVVWGERGNPVHKDDERYVISCSYDEYGQVRTDVSIVQDSLVAAKELQMNMGFPTKAIIELRLTNVLGTPITGSVPLGRIVQLRGQIINATAFRAISCTAYNDLSSYDILRAGCGDGIVFPQSKGFSTVGNEVRSPFFAAFRLAHGLTIAFKCTFTVCSGPCDGNSCQDVRRRRDTSLPTYFKVTTDEYTIFRNGWSYSNSSLASPLPFGNELVG